MAAHGLRIFETIVCQMEGNRGGIGGVCCKDERGEKRGERGCLSSIFISEYATAGLSDPRVEKQRQPLVSTKRKPKKNNYPKRFTLFSPTPPPTTL
jgi:hypothetical protein